MTALLPPFPIGKYINQNLFLAGIHRFWTLLVPVREQLEISCCIPPMSEVYYKQKSFCLTCLSFEF